MGQWMSTAATAASGTKAASSPRKRYKGLRKYRCYTATGEGGVEIIASWGRFKRVARPGFNCVWCCFGQSVAGRLSTALQHQEVQCECKTADGVFVELVLSMQYRVAQDRLYEAFYSMDDPQAQVTSYVLDALGTTVAAMPIEQLFAHREEMVCAVRRGLQSLLHSHGFALEDCLITGQGLARFLIAISAGVRESLKVLVTGRIRQEDLSFPHPPPGDNRAALEAAAVFPLPPPPAKPEDGQLAAEPAGPAQQERQAQQAERVGQAQAQAERRDAKAGGRGRKAPPGVVAGSSKELGEPLLAVDARPAPLSVLPARPVQQAKQAQQHVDVAALLLPHAPATPSHVAAAAAAARSGGAQLGKAVAEL